MFYRNFPRYMFNDINDLREFRGKLNDLFGQVVPNESSEVGYFEVPRLDMADEKNQYVIYFELPGLNREDVKVSIENNTLNIRGERKQNHKAESAAWLHNEIYSGKFNRNVKVPTEVDVSDIRAEFKNGILKIELPKKEKSNAREINIDVL